MKFGRIAALFLAVGMLCGCARKTPAAQTGMAEAAMSQPVATEATTPQPVTTEATVQIRPEISTDNQLRMIWDARDTWRVQEETDGWCYAVTDLDGNGRLEILASETHGTGMVTTLRAWEIAADGTSLASITPLDADGSGAALGSGYYYVETLCPEAVESYTDAQGITYYIYTDVQKDGYAHYYETKLAVFLKDGKLDSRVLAAMQTDYDENGGAVVTCLDADGGTISQDAYDTAVEACFAGLEKNNATIGWMTCVDFEALRAEMLHASWEHFEK